MSSTLVDDELWKLIQALPAAKNAALPPSGPQTDRRPQALKRDPLRVDRDRLATTPRELGFGSGITCWR